MALLDPADPDHAAVAERLASAPIAWLSTARRDGSPQSVPVWFAWTDRAAVVFSGAATAKVEHLRRRPRCALTLETEDGGNDVVLVDARAQLVDDSHPDVVRAVAVFVTKYASTMPEGFETWRETFSQPILLQPTRIVAWSKPGGSLRYVSVTPAT